MAEPTAREWYELAKRSHSPEFCKLGGVADQCEVCALLRRQEVYIEQQAAADHLDSAEQRVREAQAAAEREAKP